MKFPHHEVFLLVNIQANVNDDFMNQTLHALYRQLPATAELLRHTLVADLVKQYGHRRVVSSIQRLQQQARRAIAETQQLPDWCADWHQQLADDLKCAAQSALREVFNLTGTVLHTNLGRSIQAQSAIQAVERVMRSPVTLEYDIQQGQRGQRDRALASLLCQLTGAEDACIVNNNAAAVLLILAATARGKSVVVSRGELVEIGGGFRIPDIMYQAGCELLEVGTTNRTHASDYRQALSKNTAGLVMKVHTSNYQITGFTKSVNEKELAAIARQAGVPLAVDLGSGSLVDLTATGFPDEPTVQQMIAAKAGLVCFSGDKLLGGPQAGIIVGEKALIDKLQRHPLKRALRADKMTLAALEATVRLYQQPETLMQHLPVLRLLSRTEDEIYHQAQRLLPALMAHYAGQFRLRIEKCLSQAGSGSLPQSRLPGAAITFSPHSKRGAELDALAYRWRQLAKPVIGRIACDRLWLDLRCLEDEAGLLEMLLS